MKLRNRAKPKPASSARSFARSAFADLLIGVLAASTLGSAAGGRAMPDPAGLPAWLRLQPGTFARVDIAPWRVEDEPEAALTEGAASMARDFTGDATRPPDIVFRPVGVRVRIVRVEPGGTIVLVHGVGERWQGYSRTDRLIPEIPAGTALIAAGGFEGFSDFYPSLGTPQRAATRLPTRSRMVALGLGAARYDPDSADLVRVRVRVTSGELAGHEGWVAVIYTGLPAGPGSRLGSQAEKTCACRVITFDDTF